MKFFLSLVLFGFCQFAWAAVTVSGSNKFNETANCSLEDATVTKTSGSNTLTYQFSHSGKFTLNPSTNSGLAEICKVQLSSNTKTSDLIGGWKFQAATLNDIPFSFSSSTCANRLSTVNLASMDLGASNSTDKKTFRVTSINSQASTCSFTLSYRIVLVPDSNSSQGINPLQALIHVGLEDEQDSSNGIYVVSRDNNLSSVSPDPSPRSTCSLSVPSNLSLGKAKPDAFPASGNARVNASKFNIAVNCSQKLTTTFTPTVTMKFEAPLGTTCFAKNELTSADATDATIEIIREVVGGATTQICPTTATSPTTLAFKANDTTSTQLYSDTITLQAAFRGASSLARPKTGPFSTRATFTVKYE